MINGDALRELELGLSQNVTLKEQKEAKTEKYKIKGTEDGNPLCYNSYLWK